MNAVRTQRLSYKAQPVCDGDVVPTLILVFDAQLPESPKEGFGPFWRDLYAKEARGIADALKKTLPGGLLDALLVAMLDDARSIRKVPA